MPEQVACNLCGASASKPLFKLRDYRLQVDDILWRAVRCRSCGLGYLNPRPTRSEIGRYYPRDYFSHRVGHGARFEREAMFVPGPAGKLLDIGTAGGEFLEVMQRRGWDVLGIEPTGEPRPGVPIIRSPFPEGCELPSDRYDCITAWAVFEHLHDPSAAFNECARMLRRGGRLIVQVPNLSSLWALALQEDVPRHLYFFDARSLAAYGEQAGLSMRRVHHTTKLFGGSGRGVLRLLYSRALGKSVDEFFDTWRMPRRERWRSQPLFTAGWSACAAVEGVLLADRVVEAGRFSGQIVAEFQLAD